MKKGVGEEVNGRKRRDTDESAEKGTPSAEMRVYAPVKAGHRLLTYRYGNLRY